MKNMKNETSVTWHNEVLNGVRIHQAYVFAVTPENEVLLVRDKDEERFTLPGGSIEGGETPEQGILRELREEAQVDGKDLKLLGTVEVKMYDDNGKLTDHHQQIRYACKVDSLGEFTPLKDGFEVEERIAVDPFELPKYIHWLKKPNGQALMATYFEWLAERP